MGELKEIEKKLKDEVKKNPDDPEVHFKLGLFYFNVHMHEEAADAYEKAIKLNPDYAEAYHALGCEDREMKKIIPVLIILISGDIKPITKNEKKIYEKYGNPGLKIYRAFDNQKDTNRTQKDVGIDKSKMSEILTWKIVLEVFRESNKM